MKKCKNIWIFNHYAITPDLPGGTRHFDFARELRERGYNVTIFASAFIHGIFQKKKLRKGQKFRIEKYEGINFVWINTFPYKKNNWRRILNMLSYSFRSYIIGKNKHFLITVSKPDIIIGSFLHPFACLTAYKLSRLYDSYFILEVRDLYPASLIELHNVSPKSPLIGLVNLLMQFLYNKALKIIVLLPKASEYIKTFGVPEEKIVWIPNGVNTRNFLNLSNNNSRREGKFIVTYVGSHGLANNLFNLIEAAKILQKRGYSNIVIKFIGNGIEKPKLIDMAKKYNLKNVIFSNPVPKAKAPLVLSKSDILYFGLLGRRVFRFGISSNKLFDYLAAGKPIIFSSNSSNNPVAEAGAGLTVPPEDPKAVAEAIIKLYNMSEEERDQMGRNGRNYVEKYYSIPVLVDKLEKVIREVCNESSFNKRSI